MKRIIAITLALILALSLLTACGDKTGGSADPSGSASSNSNTPPTSQGTGSTGGDALTTADYDTLKSKLGNYDVTMTVANGAVTRELLCQEALIFQDREDDKITYTDYVNHKQYLLDPRDMTGRVTDTSEGYNGVKVSGMIMINGRIALDLLSPKKDRSDTIDGRGCTVYAYGAFTSDVRVWVDDETGVALKQASDTTNEITFAVTAIKIGGVKVTDWINLSDYTITEN